MKQQSFSDRLRKIWRDNTRLGTILTVVIIAVVVVFNAVMFGMANKFTWYFREETELKHAIGTGMKSYMTEVADRGDVNIIFCDSEDALVADEAYNLVWQTANEYANTYSYIKVKNVNIYTQPEEVQKFKYGINPETGKEEQINKISKDVVIFEGEKDFVVLPMQSFFILDSQNYITAYNGEEMIGAMVHRVQTPEARPTAYFTISHGETYSAMFMNRLIAAGYEMKTVDLIAEADEFLKNYKKGDVLVISSPRYDFIKGHTSEDGSTVRGEIELLNSFLSSGGSVLAMLDPLVTNTVKLEAFLTTWGITIRREVVDGERHPVSVCDMDNSVTTDGYTLISEIGNEGVAAEIRKKMESIAAGRVIVSRASPITLETVAGKKISSLLSSSSSSEGLANGGVIDSEGNYTIAAISSDEKSGGSIFAVSSVYLTAEDALTSNEYGNRDLLLCMMGEMSDISVPIGATRLLFDETHIEDLTMWEARLWTVLFAVVLPLAALACGGVILIRRRNR